MKTLLLSYKFVFMTLITLPLAMCSNDENPNEETSIDIEANAQLVEMKKVRSMTPHNACNGYNLNQDINGVWVEESFPNVNLSLGFSGTSHILGEFGASDPDAILDFRMVIARKKTIDKNKESFASVNYSSDGRYSLLDAAMTQTDYYFYKKGGGTLFITKDKKYKTERYTFGDRYVEGFAFSSAAQFASYGFNSNGVVEKDETSIYYTEDNVFSADENTIIPMYRYVDYRMLIQLRFLIRNGAREVSFLGFKEDGTEISFNLNEDSDLIAISDELESNNIETIIFSAKGDYRIDYFRGIIFSDEAEDNKLHNILYKYGEPIFD